MISSWSLFLEFILVQATILFKIGLLTKSMILIWSFFGVLLITWVRILLEFGVCCALPDISVITQLLGHRLAHCIVITFASVVGSGKELCKGARERANKINNSPTSAERSFQVV